MTLEELLNTLCEKGWKPFGMGKKRKVFARGDKTVSFSYQDDEGIEFYTYLIRDVVSKESGLWQFVCDNGMLRYAGGDRAKNYDEYANECDDCYRRDSYQYRLIESALCDEDKLEEFLLENIKVE